MPRKLGPTVVEAGQKGGRARAANMTAEQRRVSARKAARARWGTAKRKKAATAAA